MPRSATLSPQGSSVTLPTAPTTNPRLAPAAAPNINSPSSSTNLKSALKQRPKSFASKFR